MNHAEKVEKIVKRVRQALLSYGMQGVQLEDIITMVSQIVYEEVE